MRQIVLDTETTGLEPDMGHRIIEIGGVEMVNRRLTGRHFHEYINPDRDIDDGAQAVHGITAEFLADKPRFADIVTPFLDFIRGADLVIHNAAFDVSFLNYELKLMSRELGRIEDVCSVTDSLAVARKKHPGQKNNLDALCRRYQVDNSQRELHGALLDAEILADVYLLLTGGQTQLFAGGEAATANGTDEYSDIAIDQLDLKVVRASVEELADHEAYLDRLEQASGSRAVWPSH